MAYNEGLAHRIRTVLAEYEDVREQRMFGALAFMHRGNLCCGILDDDLIVRVGREQYEKALAQPYTRVFDFTGRPMRGIIIVSAPGIRDDSALSSWLRRGLQFASTLPAK